MLFDVGTKLGVRFFVDCDVSCLQFFFPFLLTDFFSVWFWCVLANVKADDFVFSQCEQ